MEKRGYHSDRYGTSRPQRGCSFLEKKTDESPFLSLEDRESFSVPKEKLEQEYAEAYRNWKRKDTEENRNRILAVLDSFLRQYVRSLPGTDPNYMTLACPVALWRRYEGMFFFGMCFSCVNKGIS
ncbi:MAG: hypothetical protein LBQ54_14920 [Planctomycetaceae bacterium]|nr:hypothetical protein [Planctomycetaceae bacterium]